jgi:hypothetical protein
MLNYKAFSASSQQQTAHRMSQLIIKRGTDTEARKINMTSINYMRFKVALNEY